MKYFLVNLVRLNFVFACMLFIVFPKDPHNAQERRVSLIPYFLSWASSMKSRRSQSIKLKGFFNRKYNESDLKNSRCYIHTTCAGDFKGDIIWARPPARNNVNRNSFTQGLNKQFTWPTYQEGTQFFTHKKPVFKAQWSRNATVIVNSTCLTAYE